MQRGLKKTDRGLIVSYCAELHCLPFSVFIEKIPLRILVVIDKTIFVQFNTEYTTFLLFNLIPSKCVNKYYQA